MPGNPFKPKAAGYQTPQDPVLRLTEQLGKMSGAVENLFQGFTHLGEAVKAMDRMATRVAFMAAITAGPRSPIPYDLRDSIRHFGHQTGIKRAGPWQAGPPAPYAGGGHAGGSAGGVVGGRSAPPPLPKNPSSKYGLVRLGPGPNDPWVPAGPGGLPYGPGNPARPKGGMGWNAGRNGGVSGPINLPGGPGGGGPGGPGGGGPARPNFAGGATQTFFASSIASAALMKSASPIAADTMAQSFELMLAKFGRGTIGPSADLSRNMQAAGNWADRNPELAAMLAKTVVVTAGLTGLAVVINIMATAARNAAASLQWLALSGRAAAGGQAGSTVAQAGSKGGFIPMLGSLGPAAAVVGGILDTRNFAGNLQGNLSNGIPQALQKLLPSGPQNYSSSYGFSDFAQDSAWGIVRQFMSKEEYQRAREYHDSSLQQLNPFKRGGWVEKQLGFSPNPFDWFGLGSHDKPEDKKKDGFLTATSNVHPAFVGLEDVYKQITLSALEPPLEAAKNNVQRQNDLNFMAEAMGKGIDSSATGQAIQNMNPPRRP